MDVLRRLRALSRRPEKLVEDSLSADLGALHLHHPGWYAQGHASKAVPAHLTAAYLGANGHNVSLMAYDDLHSLSSADLGFSLSALLLRPTTPSANSSVQSDNSSSGGGERGRVRWPRPLSQQLGQLKCVAGPMPKFKVRAPDKRKKTNEVFRSNSFRFERYEREEQTSLNAADIDQKKVR
jgi:hypothetical protein